MNSSRKVSHCKRTSLQPHPLLLAFLQKPSQCACQFVCVCVCVCMFVFVCGAF